MKGNTIKFYPHDGRHYHVKLRKRSDCNHYSIRVYIPSPEHSMRVRNIVTRIRIRDILRTYSFTRMQFIDDQSFVMEDIFSLLETMIGWIPATRR